MKLFLLFVLILIIKSQTQANNGEDIESGQCTIDRRGECEETTNAISKTEKYREGSNIIHNKIEKALRNYIPCAKDESNGDTSCNCHADVITRDLEPYEKKGITKKMIEDSTKYGTLYKIHNKRLYRAPDCMFPARCTGIEYFLLRLLPQLPDMDLVINTRDWPQLREGLHEKGTVFSFSKTHDYSDIMYPAWTFWAGGPAISTHPTGIGRWDLQRQRITIAAAKTPWTEKRSIGFFRGSRTSDERDALVLLSRRLPDLVDAAYTKNQAWKSPRDTLNAEPAKEVTFEDHCQYKFLFNFRGVAASFRLKHLFLCKSLIFHVGNEWNEFFYFAMKPWVHYVPLKMYPSEEEMEEILLFFREHDELAEQIAERGFQFIWHHLRMDDVECYWHKLLLRYQKLLRYSVTENKNLIEIKHKR